METEPGNEFSECHKATEHPLTTTSGGGFCRVTSANFFCRNRSGCWLPGEGQKLNGLAYKIFKVERLLKAVQAKKS